MKTPDEIKKGLECCLKNALDPCIGCPYERIGDDEWKCGLNADALALIQQLEAQVPKWISVKEKLPQDEEEVLVVYEYLAFRNIEIDEYNHKAKVWRGLPHNCKVTHWMPLPKPPKEEEK